MKNGLVSIITPCYNMEKYITRLMDSVIAQTYRPLEFILVDDGSTDNSYNVAKDYEEKFALAGINYKLIHQDNKGLGGAINAGLKEVSGEYICWPDADDYLEATSVEERVTAFKEHPDCAVVTSNAYMRDCSNLEEFKVMITSDLEKHSASNQFLYHLNAESIFCPGCHMVKAEAFFEVNPDCCIYPAKRGQNWQMLLPVYYKYNRYFLNKPLYNYVIYPNSMSRGDDSYEKSLHRFNEHEKILRETLKKIEKVQNVDVTEYSRFLDDKYAKLRMELAIKYKKTNAFIEEYRIKQINVGLDKEDILSYIRHKNTFLNRSMSAFYRVRYGCYPEEMPEKQIKKLKKDIVRKELDQPKVAVLIPVYNGAKFIDQCFGYLINQRYKNVEVIVINDGSTDDSEEILCRYEEIFENRGFSYKHIQQPNSRLAIAMNNAMQYVTAEYIMIYEIDDVLYRDGILDKVRYLQVHPECGMVRNNGYYINSFTECGKRLFVNTKVEQESENVFERILDGTANNWPASYLIRKDVFFELLGESHKIYEHPGGCHLQFMMPMAYASKVGFIDKPLMGYYVHIDSDSHKGGVEAAIKRTYQYGEIRSEVVKRIEMSETEKKHYLEIVEKLYDNARANYAISCNDKRLFTESAEKLGWSSLRSNWKWIVGTGILRKPVNFFTRGIAACQRKYRNIRCNMKYLNQNSKGYLW